MWFDIHSSALDLDDSCRKLDLTSSFFKQPTPKNKTFTLLKERVFTTCDGSISYTEQEKAGCQAAIGCAEVCKKFVQGFKANEQEFSFINKCHFHIISIINLLF